MVHFIVCNAITTTTTRSDPQDFIACPTKHKVTNNSNNNSINSQQIGCKFEQTLNGFISLTQNLRRN